MTDEGGHPRRKNRFALFLEKLRRGSPTSIAEVNCMRLFLVPFFKPFVESLLPHGFVSWTEMARKPAH
jgi:hypothetical protein